MGCGVSSAVAGFNPNEVVKDRSHDDEADQGGDFFTPQQKKLVTRTWKFMGSDLTGVGSKVFLFIFMKYPQVKRLFPRLANDEGDALLRNVNFKGHASRFMQAVGAVVDHLDNPYDLAPLLLDLGRQHINFTGFKQEYFEAFTEGMMAVWREELGRKKFTEEVEFVWRQVFDFIMCKLSEGYAEATQEITA